MTDPISQDARRREARWLQRAGEVARLLRMIERGGMSRNLLREAIADMDALSPPAPWNDWQDLSAAIRRANHIKAVGATQHDEITA